MNVNEVIVGIDLGTTNSSIAWVRDGRPEVIEIDGSDLLPSVVGVGPDGTLLVGAIARNQRHLYPERTIVSVKRRMGEDTQFALGEAEYTPVEVSAMILRRLCSAAEAQIGRPVRRAVITVPAYFSDAQRTATREAGEVAGLSVERILNEPTAAALGYAEPDGAPRTQLVYDLGGGTFDVSIVRTRGDVTEVLASHGDTQLGGDDFDALLFEHLRADHPGDLDLQGRARLERAAEDAKIALSIQTEVRVSEEHLSEQDGVPTHLDQVVDRHTYEELIEPLLERTRESVHIALSEAKVLVRELDEVVLVGGSTHTPRVAELLTDVLGLPPRRDVDPDRAVAIGAAIQGARLSGQAVDGILVDVSPFSFGIKHLGQLNGGTSTNCYRAILRRNSPLPVRHAETFYTAYDGQGSVDVRILQGEHRDARQNVPLGRFMVEGLDPEAPEGSPVVFDLALDLDGILEVKVTERRTGLEKAVTIEDAFRTLSAEEVQEAHDRVTRALGEIAVGLPEAPTEELDAPGRAAWSTATSLLDKAARLRPPLEPIDRDEVDEHVGALRSSLESRTFDAARAHSEALADVLFYLE